MAEQQTPYVDPYVVDWRFQRQGRAWAGGEAKRRYELTPEKIELIEGRIFCSDQERLHMVGLLIENLGLDAVMRLASRQAWREVLDALDRGETPADT